MSISVTCSLCGKSGRVPDDAASRRLVCRSCGNAFTVPVSAKKPTDTGEVTMERIEEVPTLAPVQDVPVVLPLTDEPQDESPRATYQVVYRGGHPKYPKERIAAIDFLVLEDRFELLPTPTSKSWFSGLRIRYDCVDAFEIVERTLGSFEGIFGGLHLKQKNNIHITYASRGGHQVLLRLEMLTGFTVMGQAKKCLELVDRLRNLRVLNKFRGAKKLASDSKDDVLEQLERLAGLREKGVLTEEEFARKKAELLARM